MNTFNGFSEESFGKLDILHLLAHSACERASDKLWKCKNTQPIHPSSRLFTGHCTCHTVNVKTSFVALKEGNLHVTVQGLNCGLRFRPDLLLLEENHEATAARFNLKNTWRNWRSLQFVCVDACSYLSVLFMLAFLTPPASVGLNCQHVQYFQCNDVILKSCLDTYARGRWWKRSEVHFRIWDLSVKVKSGLRENRKISKWTPEFQLFLQTWLLKLKIHLVFLILTILTAVFVVLFLFCKYLTKNWNKSLIIC